MNIASALVAGGAIAALAGTASAQPIVYGLSGIITDADNLTFSVFNGSLLNQNPQPSDLPLPFTGTLTIDTSNSFAQLRIAGSFTSPTRSYVFDVETPSIIGGLELLDLGGPVSFGDAFSGFDFDLALSANTGFGAFSFVDPGAVPSVPPQDIVVDATITGVEVLQVPTPGALGVAMGAVTIGVRRRRS